MKKKRHYGFQGYTAKHMRSGPIIISTARTPFSLTLDRPFTPDTCERLADYILETRREDDPHQIDIMLKLCFDQDETIAGWYVSKHGGFGKFDYDRDLAGVEFRSIIEKEYERRAARAFNKMTDLMVPCPPHVYEKTVDSRKWNICVKCGEEELPF